MVGLGNLQGNQDVLGPRTVIIHYIRKAIAPIGQLFDGGAHAAICSRDDLVEQPDGIIRAMGLKKLANPLVSKFGGCDLRVQVTFTFCWQAHVQQQQPHNVVLQFTPIEEPNDGDP